MGLTPARSRYGDANIVGIDSPVKERNRLRSVSSITVDGKGMKTAHCFSPHPLTEDRFENGLIDAFYLSDYAKTGVITTKEAYNILKQWGEIYTEETFNIALDKVDNYGEGVLDQEKFRNLGQLLRPPLPSATVMHELFFLFSKGSDRISLDAILVILKEWGREFNEDELAHLLVFTGSFGLQRDFGMEEFKRLFYLTW